MHLAQDHRLNVVVPPGVAGQHQRIADQLIGAEGVKYGRLAVTMAGKYLPL